MDEWFEVINQYQSMFYENPTLPDLLRRLTRFDVINNTSKGTRPPSRLLNIKQLEERPDAIRAIPWSRSFLLAGIHNEAIGTGILAKYGPDLLHDRYQKDPFFRSYVKNIAYAVVRTDLSFAWKTLLGYVPDKKAIELWSRDFIPTKKQSAEYLLAWIHEDFQLAKCFVYRSLYGIEPGSVERISDQDLLGKWPNLLEEVRWKEKHLIPYKALLQHSKQNPEFIRKGGVVKDLFTGSLTAFNTDICFFHPEVEPELMWE